MVMPHSDMPSHSWLTAYLSPRMRAVVQLMRLERPIGAWLLMLAGWAGILLAAPTLDQQIALLLLVFAAGSLLMRCAGCIINDLWDRRIDSQVRRTASRPLASGRLRPREALFALAVTLLLVTPLALLLDTRSLLLGMLSLLPVALYPLAKRLFIAPQIILGLTFNLSALVGVSAVVALEPSPSLPIDSLSPMTWPWAALALYLGCAFWTLGYDTIYAAQDRDDDIRLGLHSLAPKVAGRPRYYIGAFYAVAVLLWGLAAWLAGLSSWTLLGLGAVAGHLAWQVVRLEFDLAARCLALFRANFWTGLLLCGAYLLGTLV